MGRGSARKRAEGRRAARPRPRLGSLRIAPLPCGLREARSWTPTLVELPEHPSCTASTAPPRSRCPSACRLEVQPRCQRMPAVDPRQASEARNTAGSMRPPTSWSVERPSSSDRSPPPHETRVQSPPEPPGHTPRSVGSINAAAPGRVSTGPPSGRHASMRTRGKQASRGPPHARSRRTHAPRGLSEGRPQPRRGFVRGSARPGRNPPRTRFRPRGHGRAVRTWMRPPRCGAGVVGGTRRPLDTPGTASTRRCPPRPFALRRASQAARRAHQGGGSSGGRWWAAGGRAQRQPGRAWGTAGLIVGGAPV